MKRAGEQGKSRRVTRVSEIIAKYPKWLSLLAGGLSATGFAPLNLWPVTLIALALWMAIVAERDNWKGAALSGWLFGLGHFVVGLNWIAKAFTFQSAMPEWLGYIAVVLLSLYLAVYPALAAFGGWFFRTRPLAFMLAFAGQIERHRSLPETLREPQVLVVLPTTCRGHGGLIGAVVIRVDCNGEHPVIEVTGVLYP